MIKKVNRNEVRQARHARVRKTVSGTTLVPRLNVFKSNSTEAFSKFLLISAYFFSSW